MSGGSGWVWVVWLQDPPAPPVVIGAATDAEQVELFVADYMRGSGLRATSRQWSVDASEVMSMSATHAFDDLLFIARRVEFWG